MSILDQLLQIRGVTWQWNEAAAAAGKTPGEQDAGVIAQEVEAVFPHLVATIEGHKRVNYTGLVGVLIEAIRELKAMNEALRQRVEKLEEKKASGLRPQDPDPGLKPEV